MCALWKSEDPLREAVIINHKVKLVPKFPDLPSTLEILNLGNFLFYWKFVMKFLTIIFSLLIIIYLAFKIGSN